MGLILILLVLGVVSGVVLAFTISKHLERKNSYDDGWMMLSVFPVIGLIGSVVAIMVIVPSVWVSSGAAAKDLTVFHDTTAQNYIYAVKETADLLSSDELLQSLGSSFITGSLEKQQLTTAVSARIAEYRNDVAKFNARLARHQFMQSNFFMRGLYQRVPDRVQPIVIGVPR